MIITFRPTVEIGSLEPNFRYLNNVLEWLALHEIKHKMTHSIDEDTYQPLIHVEISDEKECTFFAIRWRKVIDQYSTR